MGIQEIVGEIVKETNKAILEHSKGNKVNLEELNVLKERIVSLMGLLKTSESKVNQIIEKRKKSEKNDQNVIYVRQSGLIKAILSKDIEKPEIIEIEKIAGRCHCLVKNYSEFPKLKNVVIIDNLKDLYLFDQNLKSVILEVFDHTYRSYKGFTCYLSVFTQDGILYIIDCLKFRKEIPKLRLLNCGVQKIIHCRKCVERLFKDFGEIGCFQNFNVDEEDIFIDFRIRPINDVFVQFISESFLKTLEKVQMELSTEKYEVLEENPVAEFIDEYRINHSSLSQLLTFRDYLALENDEGLQYVIPDEHILLLLTENPQTIDQFTSLLPRMSPLTRLYATDMLIILSGKGGAFSLNQLKSNSIDKVENEIIDNDFYRKPGQRFGVQSKTEVNTKEDDSSDFFISDD